MYCFGFTKCNNTTFGMVKFVSPSQAVFMTDIHKNREERRDGGCNAIRDMSSANEGEASITFRTVTLIFNGLKMGNVFKSNT